MSNLHDNERNEKPLTEIQKQGIEKHNKERTNMCKEVMEENRRKMNEKKKPKK